MDTTQSTLYKMWRDGLTPDRLKTIRKSMGMSQSVMGQILNVTASSVSRWERLDELPNHRYLEFYRLFDKFTQKHILEKGDIQKMLLSNGLPFTIYRLLELIYKDIGESDGT